ncbi:MAG TPA: 5'-3' exonuclease H3TH domain-containing protein [Polyangiaceae bacterium]|nr:5'-3' exonuclease H3TH domain-containing protein [Polyangiaceae bacterium]
MKVHLVDGTYELFRSYYGAPSAKSPSGMEVGATRGILSSLLYLLRSPEVTHVAVAFDTVIESFRNELFAGYKTGAGIDPDLYAQFPLAERATRALGLVTWSMIEFEADDALAAAAARFATDERVEQVLICSPDKDLMQCVQGERIVVFDRLRKIVLDEDAVRKKFGVPPRAIPDLLALVGDTADGIPGIPHWGAKSAATLLDRFGSLEAIPTDPAAWGAPVRGAARLAESLALGREVLPLYKRLATLRTDVPLTESLDDLEWKGAPPDAIAPFCEEIGFTKFTESLSMSTPTAPQS